MRLVICPICKAAGQKSTVEAGMTLSTCLGWTRGHYDEDGNWVSHVDPNTYRTQLKCSNGHRFERVRQGNEGWLTVDGKRVLS